jgi:NADPH-dependent 2,4-dienoyl-CoA reductase/sulfur reductase-like enzyme
MVAPGVWKGKSLMNQPNRDHAIVIGGGMAGLLATRVLSERYQQVTLIERDRYPAEPIFRAGVPQGRHAHVLLAKGQALLEDLFPCFLACLVA